MKFVIISALAAVAFAAPQYSYYALPDDSSEEIRALPAPAPLADSSEELTPYHYDSSEEVSSEEYQVVPILKDVRVHEEDGRYNLDVETGNGIVLAQSGSPVGPDGSVVKAGQYSYTAPDGTPVVVKFVANENGFQPQSDLLPVAPAFPHPIPQFVLDQIAFAAAEDAAKARAGYDSSEEVAVAPAPVPTPIKTYGYPQ